MGKIYIIEDELNRVKIGKSIDPKRRMSEIKSKIGMNIISKYVSENLDNYSDIEVRLLRKFRKESTIGEWVDSGFDSIIFFAKDLINKFGIKNEQCKNVKPDMTSAIIRVNSRIKERFVGAYKFINISKTEALEEAMQDFVEKHIEEIGKK